MNAIDFCWGGIVGSGLTSIVYAVIVLRAAKAANKEKP